MDVASFLRKYARNYTSVDKLFDVAVLRGLVKSREEFAQILMRAFRDPEVFKRHIYTELPFKRCWTKVVTPSGMRVGLIRWVD